jgi:serine/threonine protein kinase
MPVGSKLGHFNLLEEIAHGGMGTVYRAFDSTLNREVAIKVLRDRLARDPKFLDEFLREARSAAAINHAHIVQVYFVGSEDGDYYIVMELLKGRTMRQIVEQDGAMDEERALELAIQVAEALRAAYQLQMIHGDIKPANIFVDDRHGAKVLDFGLAKLANVEVAPTDGIWGSPYYISPERVGQKAEDFRSDVYSLGATLFHILTGRPPFDAENPEELALKRLNEKPPLLRDMIKNVTPKTEQVVNKMLNKSIFLRYRDYDALLEDLRGAKTEATAKRLGVDLHPELRPPAPEPAHAASKKSPLPLVLAGSAAVLLIVGVLTFVFWPKPPKPTPTGQPPKPTGPAPRTYTVEFTLRAPAASAVYVAGDFNDWSATAMPLRNRGGGEWFAVVPLVAGRHQYKFVVDGRWMPDPDNPLTVDDTLGGKNSVVDVSAQATQPTPAATKTPPPAAGPVGKVYTVEFSVSAPAAKKVYLAGSFNNWSQTATPLRKDAAGTWSAVQQLRPGRYQYKFVIDGAWTIDKENNLREPDSYGGHNSVVVVGP